MLFTSLPFVILLATTLILYYLPWLRGLQVLVLIVASFTSIALKEAFESRFPPAGYPWLPDSNARYETDDGIHLAAADARAFAGQLRRMLDQQP